MEEAQARTVTARTSTVETAVVAVSEQVHGQEQHQELSQSQSEAVEEIAL